MYVINTFADTGESEIVFSGTKEEAQAQEELEKNIAEPVGE